jgi:hypothetical protein
MLLVLVLDAAVSRHESLSRGLRWTSCGASGLVALAQVIAAATGDSFQQRWPLIALVGANAVIAKVLVYSRRGLDATRIARLAAMAWFALAALHFAGHQAGGDTAASLLAILAYHAANLLAIHLLLQGFPFALTDLFRKQAARSIVLTGVFLGGAAVLLPDADARTAAVVVFDAMVTALVAPTLGHRHDRTVARVWLRRPDLAAGCADFPSPAALADDATCVPDGARRWIAPDTAYGELTVTSAHRARLTGPRAAVSGSRRHGARVVIQTLDYTANTLLMAATRDGRRLRRDDVASLALAARETDRPLDVVRRESERRANDAREADVPMPTWLPEQVSPVRSPRDGASWARARRLVAGIASAMASYKRFVLVATGPEHRRQCAAERPRHVRRALSVSPLESAAT